MNLLCWNCGASLADVPRPISRHATCDKCFNELHCCRLCRHYDEKRSMQCFEDRADPPLQKENANFCDFFRPSPNAYKVQVTERSNTAKEQLTGLFLADTDADADGPAQPPAEDASEQAQNPESGSTEDLARKKLDDLFG